MPDPVSPKLTPVEGNPFGEGMSVRSPLGSAVEMALGGPIEIAKHAARSFTGNLLFPGERHIAGPVHDLDVLVPRPKAPPQAPVETTEAQ